MNPGIFGPRFNMAWLRVCVDEWPIIAALHHLSFYATHTHTHATNSDKWIPSLGNIDDEPRNVH